MVLPKLCAQQARDALQSGWRKYGANTVSQQCHRYLQIEEFVVVGMFPGWGLTGKSAGV